MENLNESKSQDANSKKRPFEDLNKEELIAKCKGLLALAQKAKHAKLELQNEVDDYKARLNTCELDKKGKDDNIQTLQELVDSLTEQKLTFITEIDTAQSKLKVLNTKCGNYEEEINKQKDELSNKEKSLVSLTKKLSDFDSEIISLKRQNNRLLEENEQLINQMTELETRAAEFNQIGLQQRDQLRTLEERVQSDKNYQDEFEELKKRIKELENVKEDVSKCINDNSDKLEELKILYEKEKTKNEKANNKLRIYKDKILKCASCINQLKNSRFILNKTVMEYSENIPKWQNEIIKASKVLDEQINDLNKENIILKTRVKELEAQANNNIEVANQIADFKKKLLNSNNHTLELNNKITNMKSERLELDDQIKQIMEENKILQDQVIDVKEQLYKESTANKELKKSFEDLMAINKQLSESMHSKRENDDIEVKLMYQIKSLESEKAMLVKEKFIAKDNIVDLENQNKFLSAQMEQLKSKCEDFQCKFENMSKQYKLLQDKNRTEKEEAYNNLKEESNSLKDQYETLKKEYDNLQDLNSLLREEVETLKLSLERPNYEADNLSDINESLQADIIKLETKLSAYKQENALLLTEVKESRAKIKEFDKLIAESEDARLKCLNYKTENNELLNEMKEINQALKERGEAISKMQKAISEMERLIETLERDRDSVKEERNGLLETIDALKFDLNNAVKHKTETNDTSEKLLVEKENSLRMLKEHETTIAALHEEIEKLKQQTPIGAELPNEDMSTSTISRAEEHARMRDLDETFEDKYSKLRLFALKLKKKLNETTSQLQVSEQEKVKLKKMLDEDSHIKEKLTSQDVVDSSSATNKSIKELEINKLTSKIKSLNDTIDTLEQQNKRFEVDLKKSNEQLSKEIDSHKITKEQLEKASRDVKKKNVLSLEMEDYERSMKELTVKMEDNKKKMIQMESTIDTQEGTITAMKTQIKLLEEQIKTEESLNRRTREELHNAIEESKEKDNIIRVKNDTITNLSHELEDEKRKKEEYDIEMTAVLSEKEKAIISHAEEKIELNNKMKRLEFRCAELNDKLQITNTELADLKTEYTSYKVRAQAVLRQNQTVDHSQEEHLKEEAAAFKTQVETLTQKLAGLQEQCAEAIGEVEVHRKRAAEAGAEAGRAHTRTARLTADLARLSQQLDAERAQHKLQVSTLTQCYKSQINELEAKLQKETESFKKQLALFQENVNAVEYKEVASEKFLLPVIPKEEGSDGEMDINVSLIPREEGEGSESAPSPLLSKPFLSGNGRRSPISLERLLEEGVSEDDGLDRSSLALTSEQEIAELRRQVQGHQQKVKHLTLLLAESERECARMAQLSELLKTDLRRVRGSSHAEHNTEYMKNVTLKFLTLPPGDERSRLIPVLQKILTLSNEETQKIQAIAKGQDPNSSKGWGSYLPWPGK